MSYKTALIKSIDILENYTSSSLIEEKAKQELIDSFNKSLLKIDDHHTEPLDDGYKRFYDDENNLIKGIKLHEETNCLHLYGLLVHKRIRLPGEYPVSNKKEFTIIKDSLRNKCPVSKFRQFKMNPNQVDWISVNNLKLLPPFE